MPCTCRRAGGVSADVIQREGRWSLDAYKRYVRSYGESAKHVWLTLVDTRLHVRKPGQGTKWGMSMRSGSSVSKILKDKRNTV